MNIRQILATGKHMRSHQGNSEKAPVGSPTFTSTPTEAGRVKGLSAPQWADVWGSFQKWPW